MDWRVDVEMKKSIRGVGSRIYGWRWRADLLPAEVNNNKVGMASEGKNYI